MYYYIQVLQTCDARKLKYKKKDLALFLTTDRVFQQHNCEPRSPNRCKVACLWLFICRLQLKPNELHTKSFISRVRINVKI